MNTHKFAQRLEWLLFTGAIDGNPLLTLYQQFKHYQQGTIGDAEMQRTIDDVDPDLAVQPHWEENPLDL